MKNTIHEAKMETPAKMATAKPTTHKDWHSGTIMSLPQNPTDWIVRAFLQVEGVLASEIATPSGEFISEDYVRSAMLRGLMLANPQKAYLVRAEMEAPWSGNPEWSSGAGGNNGRPRQHDVGVVGDGVDAGLVCEVKWLKQAKSQEVIADLWKLAFTRGTADENAAVRCFMLVGGEATAFSDTLHTLQRNKVNFRWSAAGAGPYDKPEPKILNLKLGLKRQETVFNAAESVLRRGESSFRKPPECPASLRLSVRAVWSKRAAGHSWRVVLWELDHRGVADGTIPWDDHKAELLSAHLNDSGT